MDSSNDQIPYNILVTGGNGFLGKAIIRELADPSSAVVPSMIRILDLNPHSGHPVHSSIEYLQGDICDPTAAAKACEGIDLVIHTAAIVDWGTHLPSEVKSVNLEGTRSMIKASKDAGVKAMVHTSTLDVVYTGKPMINIDESQPYPERFHNMYCESKCLAEKEVLAANTRDFRTCALRAADIYGEDDPYHIDSLIDMAKSGFYVRLGNGKSKTMHVYAGNMANALIQAGRALLTGNTNIAGKAYFIADPKPGNFFEFFDQIVEGVGYRIWPKNLWIPRTIAYIMGALAEGAAFLLRPIKHHNPKFSRFAVTYTCTDYTFNSNRANRDFDYSPKYPEEEGLKRTIDFYKKKKTRIAQTNQQI